MAAAEPPRNLVSLGLGPVLRHAGNSRPFGNFSASGTFKAFYTPSNRADWSTSFRLADLLDKQTHPSARPEDERTITLQNVLFFKYKSLKKRDDNLSVSAVTKELELNILFVKEKITPKIYGAYIYDDASKSYTFFEIVSLVDKFSHTYNPEYGKFIDYYSEVIFICEKSVCSDSVMESYPLEGNCDNFDKFFQQLFILTEKIMHLGYCCLDIKLANLCTDGENLLIIDLDPEFLLEIVTLTIEKEADRVLAGNTLITYMMYQVYLSLCLQPRILIDAVACEKIDLESEIKQLPHAPVNNEAMFYTIDKLAQNYGNKEYTTLYGKYHPQWMLRYYSREYSAPTRTPVAYFTTPARHEEIFKIMYIKYTEQGLDKYNGATPAQNYYATQDEHAALVAKAYVAEQERLQEPVHKLQAYADKQALLAQGLDTSRKRRDPDSDRFSGRWHGKRPTLYDHHGGGGRSSGRRIKKRRSTRKKKKKKPSKKYRSRRRKYTKRR
jgi:hypothetical protein